MRLFARKLTQFRLHLLGMVCILALLMPVAAQAQSVSIIRDAEIESLIYRFAEPLFKAAGIRSRPKVYLVADRRFNAFVVEDGSIYINHGTILESKSPNALKAVLAHEIGHLAGGHVARIREQTEINGRLQLVSMLFGIGAVAASAGTSSEAGEMAAAFILASQSVGLNTLMAYRQSEESAADAAALRFLDQSGQSGKGLIDVLTKLEEDEIVRGTATSYLRSHPLAEDRLARTRQVAQSGRHWNKTDSGADKTALALAQAKLTGFLEQQTTVLNRYPNSDKSVAARYARIITAYKSGAAVAAIPQMARLAAAAPSNPYFQELLGQMYFESGQAAKSIAPLKKAVQLAPGETQIRILYGQALIDAGQYQEAITQLNRSVREEPDSGRAYALASRAYASLGRTGDATLAAAEAALARDQKGTALGLARQAQKELNPSSPAWLRADDIILSLD